jgi:hypothetical protein
MKKIILVLTIATIIASCGKEQVPVGLELEYLVSVDTTYLSSIEVQQPIGVLLEEVTGVRCKPCVDGDEIIHDLMINNPNRLFAIGIHVFDNPLTEPLMESKQDFRTINGTELSSYLGTVVSLPSAAINRKVNGTGDLFNSSRNTWEGYVNTELAKSTNVNLALSSKQVGNDFDIKSKVSFTSSYAGDLRITVCIIENDIIDAHETLTTLDEAYELDHVFRTILTPIGGKTVLDSIPTKTAGRVFETTLRITPNAKWNINNCKAVVYVHKTGTSKEVLQVAEVKLK